MAYKTEDLIKIMQHLTNKLGHVPTYAEWYKATSISKKVINNHFHVVINAHSPYSSCISLRYDFSYKIGEEAFNTIHDSLKDRWVNFLVMSGVGNYNYTREGLISLAKDIIADRGKLLPEQWPLSHVAIIKYFGTWESFMMSIRGYETENSLEKLIAQISEIEKKLFAFNLKLNWNIESTKNT